MLIYKIIFFMCIRYYFLFYLFLHIYFFKFIKTNREYNSSIFNMTNNIQKDHNKHGKFINKKTGEEIIAIRDYRT